MNFHVSLPASVLKAAVNISYAKDTRPIYRTILLEATADGVQLTATDGICLVRHEIDSRMLDAEYNEAPVSSRIAIPVSAIKSLKAKGAVTVTGRLSDDESAKGDLFQAGVRIEFCAEAVAQNYEALPSLIASLPAPTEAQPMPASVNPQLLAKVCDFFAEVAPGFLRIQPATDKLVLRAVRGETLGLVMGATD